MCGVLLNSMQSSEKRQCSEGVINVWGSLKFNAFVWVWREKGQITFRRSHNCVGLS